MSRLRSLTYMKWYPALIIALLASACTGGTDLEVNDTPVLEPEKFLTFVESKHREGGREDFFCYFSAIGGKLNPFVRCGPASPNFKGQQGPWATFSFKADVQQSGTNLWGVVSRGSGYRLLADEVLSRPDGVEAPDPDDISVPPVTGRVFETVWDTLDYDFHYCMAREGAYVFDASFDFDGLERVDVEEGQPVEVVTLLSYDVANFGLDAAIDHAADCITEVAVAAGARFGEVAE